MKIKLLFLLFFGTCLTTNAQDYIQLQNPSFEDAPGAAQTPMGWQDCGIGIESPPDIHASVNQTIFGVSHPAYHGNTYIGMVVRENDTWEAIGQKLPVPMQGGECYIFNIFLATSGDYQSPTRLSKELTFFKNPAVITIWGGYDYCDRMELLAQSPPIKNFDWQDYQFFFQPAKTYTHIIIEAYFGGNDGVAYNGNVLLDLASPLTIANCETGVETLTAIDSEIVIEPKVKPKAERLQTLPQLEQLIEASLPQLVFGLNENQLKKEVAAVLTKIGQAKLDFSRYRLEISIKNNPAESTKLRIQNMKDILLKDKLPATSFRIYPERVSDKEKTWVGENADLKIGLRDRLSTLK
ncbi:MAG: hypothetical protein ACI9XO_001029 [Paraglaciecola sp.]|jgi:hypothetical protein